MKVRLRIDGIDRSSLLPRTSWTIEDSEGKRISTLTLPLEDRTGALAASALKLKEVILDDPDAPTTRYFLGIVTQVDTRPLAGVGLKHDIVCQEYGWLLDHYFYTARYANQNDSAIISNAFAGAGLSEIDATTNVQTGRSIEKFVMNNRSLRAMMDALAEITGYIWYVDWTKKLVYQSSSASVSAYSLTDAPSIATDLRYQKLMRSEDYIGFVTKISITGGIVLSAAKYVGNGQLGSNGVDTVVTSGDIATGPSDTQNLPDVDINTGSDGSPIWSAQTVGDKAGDDVLTDFNCLWDWMNLQLTFNTAPPNLTKSYRLYGRSRQPFAFVYEDAAALAEAGRSLTMHINDEDIRTEKQAYDRITAIIREKAKAREKVTLISNEDTFRSGQEVTLVNAKMGINKVYSIRRIVTRFLGGTLASREMTLTNPAKLNPDVLDMIAAGWRAAHPVIAERDSEMLVVFMSFTETALPLADATLEAFGTSGPYRIVAKPVSFYPFEEGQGAIGEDRYGDNDLALVGSPTWEQGKKGYAIRFDGSTQYGKKTTASGLPTTAMTIACWIKIDILVNWRVIVAHDKLSDGGWNLNVDSAGNLNFTVHSGVSDYTASKSCLAINTWYHVAGVYDGANVKVFIDGVAGTDAALVGATLDSVGDLYVGCDDTLANFFDGLPDELWLFPSALSQAGIQSLRDFKEIRVGFMKLMA